MKLKGLLIATVVILGLGIGVAGFLGFRYFFAPKDDDAISLVPKDAFIYGTFFLEPSTQQKLAIEDLLAKTPLKDFDTAAERLKNLFDEGLADTGCTFEDDFEPWLGDQAAGFGLPPEDVDQSEFDGALLLAVDDEDAARDAFVRCGDDASVEEEKSYKDVPYELMSTGDAVTTLDGFLVVGSERGLEATIDAREADESLEDSDRYEESLDELSNDNLASLYVDLQPVVETLEEDSSTPPEELQALQSLAGGFDRPITALLQARSDAVVLEYSAGVPEEGPLAGLIASAESPDVLAGLPGDSWAAFGLADFGGYVQGLLDSLEASGVPGLNQEVLEEQIRKETGLDLQNDILAWMGDLGAFVRGSTLFDLDGGVIIETDDEDAAIGATVVLGQFLAQQGAPVSRPNVEGAEGFAVGVPGVPQTINTVVGNGRTVIAFGDDATREGLAPSEPLGETEEFEDAARVLGPDIGMALYVEVPAILQLIEAAGAAEDPTYSEDVKPILESVKYVASGSKVVHDRSLTRLVIGVE